MSATAILGAIAAACAGLAAAELAAARAARRLRGRIDARRRRGPSAAALAWLTRSASAPAAPGDLHARLAAADTPPGLGAREVMALKCALALTGAVTATAFAGGLPGRLGLLSLLVVPAAAFLLPDAVLVRRARKRAWSVSAEAPDLLERVRMASEAGLAPTRALERAARHGSGPLAAELRVLAAAGACGEPREVALERLAARLPLPEVRALSALVLRAERQGSPLGPAVAALARATRAQRAQRVRDRAQGAAPKIQLIVALLLVPAVLLIVAAGLLAALHGG